MTKLYTIEVVKESRALVSNLEAESVQDADAKIAEMIEKKELAWASENVVSTSVINSREKKED